MPVTDTTPVNAKTPSSPPPPPIDGWRPWHHRSFRLLLASRRAGLSASAINAVAVPICTLSERRLKRSVIVPDGTPAAGLASAEGNRP